MIKKIILITALSFFLSYFFIFNIKKTQADVVAEIPFGGLHLLTYGPLVCDCGGNSNFILDYVTNSIIVLHRAPWSIFYSYFNNYATYQLGTWRPGASMHCMINYGDGCKIFQYNYGDYGAMPGTGTTLY